MKKKRIVWKVFATIMMVALCAFLLGLTTMMLWNWLIPEIFAGPVITFWQSLGLLLLAKLLVGFPGKGHHEGGWAWKKNRWKAQWKAKMDNMTPEEKEQMKERISKCMGGRWGWKMGEEENKTQKEQE